MSDHSHSKARRQFLRRGGAGLAATVATVAAAEAPAAARPASAKFDAVVDILVVGGGGGGLPSALFSRWLGNSVMVLEKAASVGGTAAKAAFWYWVPNNAAMRAAGTADPKPDFLRYVARLSRPETFDPEAPKFGMSDWEHAMCEAIYDSASEAAELLAQKGALPYRHAAAVPDYWVELPQDKAPHGRVLLPRDANESMSDGGRVAIRMMTAAARRDGVQIRTGHRVRAVIRNAAGRVIGAEAIDEGGAVVRVRADKAVIFATGGFTHDPELRSNFLDAPVFGGCAVHSNEGDFVRISSTLGVQLRNMNHAWMCPVSLEKAVAKDGSISGIFSMAGDSMICVDKHGRRVVNEKLAYNELASAFFAWDGARGEYKHLVLMSVWDQRAQDHCASDEFGRLIVPSGADSRHVIEGATLAELSVQIAARLEKYRSSTGGLTLSNDFAANLAASIARFNGFARSGNDLDFQRGERSVERMFNGAVKAEPEVKNPTMWPISTQGPFYAALVTGGTLDTKGGPKTSPDGQVLDIADRPIAGLYGVGNCVASASGRAYWSGGATLGPILAFALRAARSAHAETPTN